MGKQDLYVSFQPDTYRENKTELLNTELALLNSLKHLETIRQIRREKAIYKLQLKQQIDKVIEKITDLRNRLPEIPIERHSHHATNGKHLVKIKEITKEKHIQDKESDKKLEEIEKELLEINAKIRKLIT